jgi:hypothetical protein
MAGASVLLLTGGRKKKSPFAVRKQLVTALNEVTGLFSDV